jgi:hypothetical protein
MDLLTVALIFVGFWIAIVIVALAMARAAGRADADNEGPAAAAERAAAVRASERSPLEVLAEEVMRTTEKIGHAHQPVGEDRPRAVGFRKRITGTQERIRNLLH